MAILKSCCCWSNVRSGTIACGVYTMIVSMVYSCVIVVFLSDHFAANTHVSVAKGWFLATLVMCVFLFTSSVILIIGIHKDNRYMLMPWVVTTLAMICIDTAALIYECVIVGLLYFNIIQMVMWLALTLLNLYCVLCVISQIQELKAGRGTLEYLRIFAGRIIYHTGVQEVQIRYGPLMMTCSAGTTMLAPFPDPPIAPPLLPHPADDVGPPPDYSVTPGEQRNLSDVSVAGCSFQQPLLWQTKSSPPPPYCP